MIKKSSTLISGLLAFGIYITVIGLLLFYFNSRDEKKSVHYVKKNEGDKLVTALKQEYDSEIKPHIERLVEEQNQQTT